MSGLAWLKPKFAPRYLLPSLPAFITLASIGITILIDGTQTRYCRWASIGVVITLALPLASIGSLMRLYTDPSLARPDVRSVVRYIEAAELPSDAILLIGGHQAPAFNHYYRGQATVIPLAARSASGGSIAARCAVRCRSSKRSCRSIRACGWCMWQNADQRSDECRGGYAGGRRASASTWVRTFTIWACSGSTSNGAQIDDAPQYPAGCRIF